MTDGPLLRSPRSTDIVKHSGALGTASYLALAATLTMGFSSPCCAANRSAPVDAARVARNVQKSLGNIAVLLRPFGTNPSEYLPHNLLETRLEIYKGVLTPTPCCCDDCRRCVENLF